MRTPLRSTWVLILIGFDKLAKAALLVFIAGHIHQLILAPDNAALIQQWVHKARIDPENRHVHELVSRVMGISDRKLWAMGLGSYLYATLYAVEGVGLVLRQHWAEWLTAVATALFIPMEVYELFRHHHHAIKVLVLLINIAIVIYLFARLRKEHRVLEHQPPANSTGP